MLLIRRIIRNAADWDRRAWPKRRGDRGAAAVEFAILAPLLFLMFIGMAEFGLAFKDRLTVANSSKAAVRVGSAAGTDPRSDMLILEAVDDNLSGAATVDIITSVEIFEDLDGSDGQTNTYVPDGSTCGWAPCPDPTQPGWSYGGSWTPAIRSALLPDLDVVGVRINFTHAWITSIMPFMSTPAAWTETARARIEPQGFSS